MKNFVFLLFFSPLCALAQNFPKIATAEALEAQKLDFEQLRSQYQGKNLDDVILEQQYTDAFASTVQVALSREITQRIRKAFREAGLGPFEIDLLVFFDTEGRLEYFFYTTKAEQKSHELSEEEKAKAALALEKLFTDFQLPLRAKEKFYFNSKLIQN